MGVFSNRGRNREQRTTNQPRCQFKFGNNNTKHRIIRRKRRSNRRINELLRLIRYGYIGKLYNINSWRSISVHSELSRTRDDEPDDNTTHHRYRKRNRYNKHLHTIGKKLCLILALSANAVPAYAESVGGVSATANPIANSSGSVTNQAIQVLQGPYITNTYGNQISCQGPTFNATPYIQYSNSWKDPFERTYMQPQYNNNDFTGRIQTQTVTVRNYPWYDGIARGPNNADGTMGDILYEADGVTPQTIEQDWYNNAVIEDSDGNPVLDDDGNVQRYWEDGADMQIEMEVDGPDGVPDNPGEVVWEKPVRTDMSANNNFNLGLSATLSIPLDRKLQRLCKQAATTQIEQQAQITANKRLDFEIARLKNCGELMQKGIMFHPRSPYAAICADVVVSTPPGTIIPHSHDFPRPKFGEDTQPSGNAENLEAISIKNTIIETSSPSSASQDSSAASQNLSPTSPSSPDNGSSEVQPEADGKESSQASSGWLRWPFSRRASPPLEEDQPAALLGGPIQLPPSQSLP